MQAETLDEVVSHLDTIIVESDRRSSRLGYFACLYRKMTVAIKDAISKDVFEDAARMEKPDVFFANRYPKRIRSLQPVKSSLHHGKPPE